MSEAAEGLAIGGVFVAVAAFYYLVFLLGSRFHTGKWWWE